MLKFRVALKDLEQLIAKRLNKYPQIKKTIKSFRYLIFKVDFKYKVYNNFQLIDLFKENINQVFFGYYTNNAINGNELLYNETSQNVPLICSKDYVDLGVINIQTKKNKKFAKSYSWNWQQGCMLQWVSEINKIVIYNDYDTNNDKFISVIYDLSTEKILHKLGMPYNVINWEEQYLLSINYERLTRFRPDYGYFSKAPTALLKNENDGIWRLSFDTKKEELLISIEQLRIVTNQNIDKANDQWVNHLLFDSTKQKFVFLYRWKENGKINSSLFLYKLNDGTLIKLLSVEIISHYDWYNENELIIFLKKAGHVSGYYTLNVENLQYKVIDNSIFTGDGHPHVIGDANSFITDSYPDKSRVSKLMLFDIEKNSGIKMAEFFQPLEFDSEYRCDLHPRISFNNQYVSIDSAHTGRRSQYLMRL